MTRYKIDQIKRAFFANKFKYIKLELEAEVGVGDSDYTDDDVYAEFEHSFRSKLPKNFNKNIKFLKCYNDGSVDIEITMTFRVNYLHHCETILRAFKKTCLEFGDCETERAGLHITLLEGYQYPRRQNLPTEKICNFMLEMNKLMMALPFLAFPDNNFTRGFEYRRLKASDNNKYSAIYTHYNTCIEYRVFDTCYDKPKAIYRYLDAIKTTLKFYTEDETKTVTEKELTIINTREHIRPHVDTQDWSVKSIFNTLKGHKRLYKELTYLTSGKTKKQLEEGQKVKDLEESWAFFNTIKKQLCAEL